MSDYPSKPFSSGTDTERIEIMMICRNCNCANECGWYKSYNRIEIEVYTGIGTDNTLGRALAAVLRDNELHSCKYYEDKKDEEQKNA